VSDTIVCHGTPARHVTEDDLGTALTVFSQLVHNEDTGPHSDHRHSVWTNLPHQSMCWARSDGRGHVVSARGIPRTEPELV
jgi:hypothetical protein